MTSTKEFREIIENASTRENLTSLKNILLDTPYDNLEFIIDFND